MMPCRSDVPVQAVHGMSDLHQRGREAATTVASLHPYSRATVILERYTSPRTESCGQRVHFRYCSLRRRFVVASSLLAPWLDGKQAACHYKNAPRAETEMHPRTTAHPRKYVGPCPLHEGSRCHDQS